MFGLISVILLLLGHDGSVTSVNFSHDSRLLLTSSCDRTARLWSPAHSDPLMTFSSVNHNFASELDSSAKVKVSEACDLTLIKKQKRVIFREDLKKIIILSPFPQSMF